MKKIIYLRYIPMSLAAAFILFFAVKNALYPPEGQEVELWYLIFKTLPTLVSLFVQILLIGANRYGFLIGGLNSVVYSIVYFIEDIPFSAISALAVSFSLQIYSFINWGKNSKAGKVSFRLLSVKYKIITAVATVAIWVICYFWLSGYMVMRIPLLDTVIFTLGIVAAALSSLRYVESQYINTVCCIGSLVMWIILTAQNSSNFNYIVISVYNLYCVAQTAVNWTLIYIKDQKGLSRGQAEA